MKALIGRSLKRFDSEEIRRDIEEQVRFHLELLTQANLQQDMSWEDAKAAALIRFGNVEQIKNQCVEIRRRSNPFVRALKVLLILVFLVGVVVRIFSPEFHFTRIGDVLIAVGILGRLLLYVRGLSPSSFLSSQETSSPLMLSEKRQKAFTVYDKTKRTPVERVIFDK